MENKVKVSTIDKLIKNAEIDVTKQFGKVTVVTVKLENGFVITESSGCIDEANYNEKVGYDSCMKRIKDKLWLLEGYKLQTEIFKEKDKKLDLRDIPNYSVITEITGRRGIVFKDKDFACIRYIDGSERLGDWNDIIGLPQFAEGRRIVRVDVPVAATAYLNIEKHDVFLKGDDRFFKNFYTSSEFENVTVK